GEDPVSAPDTGAGQAVQAGACPAVAVFEVADAALTAGAPLDEFAECWSLFVLAAGRAGGAFSGYSDGLYAQLVQVSLDAGFAVAAIGGHGARDFAGALLDPADRGGQLRRVGRVAFLDGVVQDDAVVVVDNLALVAELDRPVDTALGDRSGVRVVQADQAGSRLGLTAGQPETGLGHHPGGPVQDRVEFVESTAQPALDTASCARERATRVTRHRGGLGAHAVEQAGQLAGYPRHGGLRLLARCGAAEPAVRGGG